MKSVGALSIIFIVSITVLPNAYAEDWNFFDWLTNLFGESEKQTPDMMNASTPISDTKKAAIIDQLERDFPNPYLQNKTITYLETAGFEVDLYTYEDITIDFYKNLPSMDYEFIVFRTHALAIKDENKEPSSWMFTGELYSEEKYIGDQLANKISRAVPYLARTADDLGFETYSKDRHFIVSSRLVSDLMVGQFPDSVIILGGCDTAFYPHFGQAFVERGASSVLGWSGLVDAQENDQVIMSLVEDIVVNGLEIDDAVDSVMKELGEDRKNQRWLVHYSSGASGEV